MTKWFPLFLAFCILVPACGPILATEAESIEDAALEAAGPESVPPTTLEFSTPVKPNTYMEHAPLALFGVGSLVVGGIFYGIHSSLEYPGGKQVSGNGSRVNMAVGAAGITALAAGASYVYYSWRGRKQAASWAGKISGGIAPDGAMAATLTLPLTSLAN